MDAEGLQLERKFYRPEQGLALEEGYRISGYASLFDKVDQGGDRVARGAYRASLAKGGGVKMLWQHDPAQPIGIWDEIREDERGLWVAGRLLPQVARAKEAAALIEAGALDGLSIGYRVKRAERDREGRRILYEVDLWEVSLVTFPMLSQARVAKKHHDVLGLLNGLTTSLRQAREELGRA